MSNLIRYKLLTKGGRWSQSLKLVNVVCDWPLIMRPNFSRVRWDAILFFQGWKPPIFLVCCVQIDFLVESAVKKGSVTYCHDVTMTVFIVTSSYLIYCDKLIHYTNFFESVSCCKKNWIDTLWLKNFKVGSFLRI